MKHLSQKATVWHNANCSTSRKVLEFIKEHFEEVNTRNYIANPPTVAELAALLKSLNMPATAILRKKDKVFKEFYDGKILSNDAWMQAMHEHPSIIERPMVIIGSKAFLGRPYDSFAANILSEFGA